MLAYIIVNKETNEIMGIEFNRIMAIEHCKIAASRYNPEISDYTHWSIEDSGAYPQMDEVFTDTRTYIEKRSAAYKLELDNLAAAAEAQVRDGDSEEESWSAWIAKRAEIKLKYPK